MDTAPILPGTDTTVRLHVFGRIRELLGTGRQEVRVPADTTIEQLWDRLAGGDGELCALRSSTRFFRNGALAGGSNIMEDGDEIGFLPPVGGG